MNSKQKGNITELETMLAFMKLGYNVLTPYGDCERYDFVVDVMVNLLEFKLKHRELKMMELLLFFQVEVLTGKMEK